MTFPSRSSRSGMRRMCVLCASGRAWTTRWRHAASAVAPPTEPSVWQTPFSLSNTSRRASLARRRSLPAVWASLSRISRGCSICSICRRRRSSASSLRRCEQPSSGSRGNGVRCCRWRCVRRLRPGDAVLRRPGGFGRWVGR